MVIFFAGYSYPLLIMALRTHRELLLPLFLVSPPSLSRVDFTDMYLNSDRGRIYSQGCAG